MDVVCGIRLWLFFDSTEQILAVSWYQTWLLWSAHHGVRFARTSLTVGEYACMEAIEVVGEEIGSK
jgi:hypothetical protein